MFEELPLNPTIHNCADFNCGIPALNEYLQRYADQHRKRGISSAYVLVEPNTPERILGYYTLSAAEIDSAPLIKKDRQKLPRYPIPCFRLGRLACRADEQWRGPGKRMLASAIDRCLIARAHVAAYALIADAKNANARDFYAHFGFMQLFGKPMAMYLPLAAMPCFA
ncbi:MAG: GNAT family N-acetyltransferase [Betaproteobacteria bacterium]|nr:GNAT family N-acetyltransferase [Betaproteobacteria bacterium]